MHNSNVPHGDHYLEGHLLVLVQQLRIQESSSFHRSTTNHQAIAEFREEDISWWWGGTRNRRAENDIYHFSWLIRVNMKTGYILYVLYGSVSILSLEQGKNELKV